MGQPLELYRQMRTIVDDLARVIGQFDPATTNKDQRALLHASIGPQLVVTVALVNKVLGSTGIAPLTVNDLLAAKALCYAEDWSTVVEQ